MLPLNLPTYVQNDSQGNYQAEMNQTLRQWLSSDGWELPNLTTAQITTAATFQPIGTIWYNTTIDAPQVLTSTGVKTFTIT